MTQRNRHFIFGLQAASLVALAAALPALAPAYAQDQAPGPQAQDEEPQSRQETVVVTANKREETVQDIAIAVTAITSEVRDQIGLTTVQDYTNFAPGLSYSTAGDRLGMRGVTRTSNNFGIRSGISNYVDGIYFSSAIPASREPIFIDRVEVVRGPQGTLYGRDSIGGALNVITKRPSDVFEGQTNIGAGNFGQLKIETTIAGPINDSLRYRVGGSRTSVQDGYLRNYSGLDSEGGRRDDSYLEGQLEGNWGERFDWWVRVGSLNWDVREGAPGGRTGVGARQPYDTLFFNSTADIGPNPWTGLADPNRIQVGSQNSNPAVFDRNGFNTDFTNYAKLSPTSELALEAVWHADTFDLKYLGGYVWYHYLLRQDQDGTPIKRFTCTSAALCGGVGRTIHTERISDYIENRAWFSNELNFISTWDGPVQLVSGIYHYQENYNQLVFVSNVTNPGGPVVNLAGQPRPVLPPRTGYGPASGAPSGDSLLFFTNNQGLNNAYGAFAQVDWELSDQWKLTAGVRYSRDDAGGREYARVVNHYVIQTLIPIFPPRIDVTQTLGGADPTTITPAAPCGFAGLGIVNTNATAANAALPGCTDKTRYGIYQDPLTGNAFRDLEASWEEVTGVLGVDWTPDNDTLIYAKYNRGYKPGGLGCANVFCVLVPTPYTDQETVDAVELGFKRDWRSWNLVTNAVAFYYDYKGYQVSNTVIPEDPDGAGPLPRPPAFTSYVNLPETRTTGFELETIWNPTDNLRFFFNYGWTNPEIGDTPALVHSLDPFARDPAAQPIGTPAPNGFRGQTLDGNILPFSPKNKAALNATYSWFFDDGSTLDASASYFWQDIAFSDIFNRSYTKIPSWDQTDARLSWTNADGNLTLIGYVRNLFDEAQFDSVGPGLREGTNRAVAPQLCFSSAATTAAFGQRPAESCYTTSETLRPPMTYGAELQFRF
jgi:iron complex outermembrane receptor protein